MAPATSAAAWTGSTSTGSATLALDPRRLTNPCGRRVSGLSCNSPAFACPLCRKAAPTKKMSNAAGCRKTLPLLGLAFATPIAASVGLVHDADLPSASITAVAGLSALANASAVPSGGSPAADAALQIALDVLPATPTLLLSMDGFPIAPTPAAFDGILLLGARTAALPADQAGDLLRGVVTPDHPVLTLNGALPGLVLSLIANGLHVAETANSIGGFPGAGPPVPNLVSPTPQSSDSSAGLAASAGAGGTSQTGAPHPHDPAIDAAVAQFIGGAPHWEVITSGRDVVVYDADILAPHSASALDSVTFTFSDGSSVSLVGTAAELLLAHSLH